MRWSRAAACLVAATVLSAAPTLLRAGSASPTERPAFAPGESLRIPFHPTRRDSILVFAAHPDDETLGAGGLIATAVAAGARVTIVIFTNGDGYIEGVDVGFHTLFSTPAKFIEYGKTRQHEALDAAARLGVSADRVVFLGYPDRGLAVLWGSVWTCDRPYMSPYTRQKRSPYPLTYHANVDYCGRNVFDDVESLLRAEHPTAIVVHHPEDSHRDHWAVEAFVTSALEHLTLEGEAWARTVRVFHYLVHHGAWPWPPAYAPDLSLEPPPDLRLSRPAWVQFPLSRTEEDTKRDAVLEYRSQAELLRTYMLSFVRRNELFDPVPPVQPSWVGDEHLSLGTPEIWDRLPEAIQGRGPGSLLQATEESAVLDGVAVGQGREHLLIGIRLRKPAIREVQYRMELRLFYRDGHMARLLLRFHAPRFLSASRLWLDDLPLPPGALGRSFGPHIEIMLPLEELGHPAGVYLNVVTISPFRTVVDRTPWTMIRLGAPEPGADQP